MCEAFSAIIGRNKKVYWKLGIDGHEELRDNFKLKDKESFCPIEITPKNDNYIDPDKWNFKFDDNCPDWWKQSHEKASWDAHKLWLKNLNSKLYKNRIRNLIHPFKLPMVKKVNKNQIKLLKQWDSVRDSVWGSVGGSIWGSVGASVGASVRGSVRDSVWGSVGGSVWGSVRDSVGASIWDSVRYSGRYSVRDSVGAYIGSMFKLKRNEWKNTEKIKTKGYPFECIVKLWKQGLVPIFDGITWRLHSGKKAKVVFEINKEELKKEMIK